MFVVCSICNKNLKNRKGLSYHVKIKHKLKFIEYVIKHELNDLHPTCKCGCGKNVKFHGGKFMSYLDHHQPHHKMTQESRDKISTSLKGKKQTKESNLKRSIATKNYHQKHPEFSLETSIRMKHRQVSSLTREKISKTRTEKIKSGEILINHEKISETVAQKYVNGDFIWVKGKYLSTKINVEYCYRSSYELTFMKLLDADPAVLDWQYEPFSLKYEFGGKIRRYIPDFIVRKETGEELIEVKPFNMRNKPANVAKRNSAIQYCLENNITYVEWEPK